MPERRPLSLGVVGVGSLGFHHVRILRDLDGVAVGGIHDSRPERASEVAEQLDVVAWPTLGALLERIDGVVVAVPTSSHESVAVAALERGVHVLIEKPMADSLAAADRILEAAERSGALVQIGHVERFNPAILAAEPYLDRPLFIESHRLAPFAARSIDVAVVLDLMIHDVDLVQSLVGSPIREIAATGVPILTPSVDIANARLTFEGGAVANLTASRVSMERMRKLRIFQPSGYLSLNLADGTGEFLRLREPLPALGRAEARESDVVGDGGAGPDLAKLVERIPLRGEPGEPLRRELANFRDAILGVAPPVVGGRSGRDALAASLAIEERIRSHVADTRPA